ncbi:hypothetical protein C2I27_03470 [Priestia megaterium]|nr:hypothetical protein C2I27_03470 [Priestia megaterium]
MQVLLNRFDNPRISEQVFVGKGSKVFANKGAEEYGFTVGKEYKVKDISPLGYLVMTNDNGETDEYTVEYFQQFQPLI